MRISSPIINADIMRGAFLAIEYQTIINNAGDSRNAILRGFDNDIRKYAFAIIADARDNIVIDYAFIIPDGIAFDDEYERMQNEMMNAINNDAFVNQFIVMIEYAFELIGFG